MRTFEIVLSSNAQKVFESLNREASYSKVSRTILNAILNKVELIKQNKVYGNPINKRLIPKFYKDKYGINNLFRIELPNFWRMLYTLRTKENEIEIVAFVLDIFNHKKYNKKFGY